MKSSIDTQSVAVGNIEIGGGAPIVVQSMCATHTREIDATVEQINDLQAAGAGIVRLAVDNKIDAKSLRFIREQTTAALCEDLQENFPLVDTIAQSTDKIRYNPGHLYHLERSKSIEEKVAHIVNAARDNDCALRIGVNSGSVDPELQAKYPDDSIQAMVECALGHCAIMDKLNFNRFVVSLKDSDPMKVIALNKRFRALRPETPLHLGVTEAGLPPGGIMKTRMAFEPLLAAGIGETIRVSLTLPNSRKADEVSTGLQIIEDVEQGHFTAHFKDSGLNIVSCPSCSRVENESFVELAEQVREITSYASEHDITIAVMGCRVNGPGETDHADIGLWCGPNFVNLKRGAQEVGKFSYEEIIGRLQDELKSLIT